MSSRTRAAMGPTSSSMAATVSPVSAGVPRTRAAGARGRALSRARWATKDTPSRVLARHYGVTASRARHKRSGVAGNELVTVLQMIEDPQVDAGPIVIAMLEAWESRFLYQPTEDLRARLKQLREVVEHRAEAEQNRAVLVHDGSADACRQHASVLIEMAAHEELLGLTERSH